MLSQLFFALIFLIIILLVFFSRFIILWMSALLSGAPISLFRIIGMRSRGVSANDVCKAYLISRKAGLKLTLGDLESAAKAGCDLENIVLGLVGADQANFNLEFSKAIELDRKGENMLLYVKNQLGK